MPAKVAPVRRLTPSTVTVLPAACRLRAMSPTARLKLVNLRDDRWPLKASYLRLEFIDRVNLIMIGIVERDSAVMGHRGNLLSL